MNTCSFCKVEYMGPTWKTACLSCYDKHIRPPKQCPSCGEDFKSRYKLCQNCYIDKQNREDNERIEIEEQQRKEDELLPENLLERIEILEEKLEKIYSEDK